ncbi:MAG: hypothetical protein LBP61_01375, partial [Desulfovibrio sp.]|nr:hypothetical protein [Desulfovibrio sp.]
MTTKRKIILGFGIMILLIGIVAGVGYFSLDKASSAFLNYRRLARVDVASSNALAETLSYTCSLRLFRLTKDTKNVDEAYANLDAADKLMDEIETLLRIQENLDLLKKVRKEVAEVRKLTGVLRDNQLKFLDLYQTTVRPNMREVGKNLVILIGISGAAGNSRAVQLEAEALELLAANRSATARFSENPDEEYSTAIRDNFLTMNAKLAEVDAEVVSSQGRAAMKALRAAFDPAEKAGQSMREFAAALNKEILTAVALNMDLEKSLRALSDSVSKARNVVGAEINAANANAQLFMIGASLAGILLGLLLAIVIILGIIRVLRDLSAFATATAKGDFSAQVHTHEKGEIGNMIESMKQIPAALGGILADYQVLEKRIEAGVLNARGEAAKYQGGFATLINGTNEILARLNMVIDSIPSPVAMLNKEAKIEYMNRAAMAVAGSDFQGKTCKQVF